MALLVLLGMLTGCATRPSGGAPQSSSSPRVRCLTDPTRDDTSTSRPLFFFFCVESP